MFKHVIAYCAAKGVTLDILGCKKYGANIKRYRNVMTWGVKRSHSNYLGNDRNMLFIENGLLRQGTACYMNAGGFFGDSSIVHRREWEITPTPTELLQLARMIDKRYCFKFLGGGAADGPILISLQIPYDAPMRHYYPAAKGMKNKNLRTLELCTSHLPEGIDAIVRPHPRQREKWHGYGIEDLVESRGWRVETEGKIYPLLQTVSAVVTVNSTTAFEAMAAGIPVATLGHHAYTGSGATLECADDPALLSTIKNYTPDNDRVAALLCAVMRYDVPMRAGREFVESLGPLNEWIDRVKPEAKRVVKPVANFAYSSRTHAPVHEAFPVAILDELRQSGLAIDKKGLEGAQVRLTKALEGYPTQPNLDKAWRGEDIVLGSFSISHLGDTVVTSTLPRRCKEMGAGRVFVMPGKTAERVFANNPYVDGFRREGAIKLLRMKGTGHNLNRVEAFFGLSTDIEPRGELYLDQAERDWALRKRLKWDSNKPVIILSPDTITRRASCQFKAWPMQHFVDVLSQHATVVYPPITKRQYLNDAKMLNRDRSRWEDAPPLTGCAELHNLTMRQYIALFSVADGYFGSHAGGSHLAAAFNLQSVVFVPGMEKFEFPYPNQTPYLKGTHVQLGHWIYPQHHLAHYEPASSAEKHRHLVFIGMQRSGNHALINWVAQQFGEPVLFQNDCKLRDGRLMPTDRAYFDGSGNEPRRIDHRFKSEARIKISSFEDWTLDDGQLPKHKDLEDAEYFVVMRDPLNFWASSCEALQQYSWARRKNLCDPARLHQWRTHLRFSMQQESGATMINFNHWFADKKYRRSLAYDLGFPFTDAGLQHVPFWGTGSSFDRQSKNNEAQQMNVLERWHSYRDDPAFMKMFDDDLLELSESVFGVAATDVAKEPKAI